MLKSKQIYRSTLPYARFANRVHEQEGVEKVLGELGAPSTFTIHTKAPGFAKDSGTKASILAGARQSLEDLGVNSVRRFQQRGEFHKADVRCQGRNLLPALSGPRHSDRGDGRCYTTNLYIGQIQARRSHALTRRPRL